MSKCRISGEETKEVFSLGNIYMSDFLTENEQPRAGECELKLKLCEKSGLLQLEDTIPQEKMYGRYWYRSGTNQTMKDELKDVVDSCLKSVKTKEGDIFLDIACNDGTLFDYVPSHLVKLGIDPSDDSYHTESSKKADEVIQDYFSAKAYKSGKYGSKKAKIVTTIAMFYDLDNPISFCNDVKEILEDNGIWVIQLSYTPLMLRQMAFDNICHEHITYYSLSSIKYLMDKVGFDIVDCTLNDVNGGSFRVFLMKKEADKTRFRDQQKRDVANFRIESLLKYEESLQINNPETYINFYNDICSLKEKMVSFIKQEKEKNKTIYGYGASTKGNTLIQWYGLDNAQITAIADRSPYKHGLRTAGTNIPIISEEQMRSEKPDYLLILPWHFIKEFTERERNYLNNGGKFIVPCPKFTIISSEDINDK